jgi:Uma2 family endonuclease
VKNALLTYADYLAQERTSLEKHEFPRGDVWAMAGGTPDARLTASSAAVLREVLKGRPCVVYSSDLRVRVESTDRSTYPDVTVVCGKDLRASDDADAITNPIVIVEVLSPTTERADRGEKFAHYQRLPSLQEYVLVSQDGPRIEVFRRQGASWLLTISEAGAQVSLASIDATLSVDEIYADPRSSSP